MKTVDGEGASSMQNRAEIAVAGDATGRLIGTVSVEDGSVGVVGAQITVEGASPAGPWRREAVTEEHGFFVADPPLCPTGPITVAAAQGDLTGALTVEAADIAWCLTPRPPDGRIDLCGRWQFLPDPPADFHAHAAGLAWKPIRVPSNYEMEGYRTQTDVAAFRKQVTVPREWAGKRIRLRAEAVYSRAEVWLNGRYVGSHDGGATPFELDLTDAARPGRRNELCLRVHARSAASRIDNMSTYAFFEIAGIWRPIELFCVEPAHIAHLTYATVFDAACRDAALTVEVKVANEQHRPVEADLALKVIDPAGEQVPLDGVTAHVALAPWEARTVTLTAHVTAPLHWNAEQPRLYRLVACLDAEGQPPATIEQPLGFRQVEIRGRCFTINGQPVRLFGACLHSADPLMGRAITAERVEQDLELMKGANLNAIRTSHYPPHPLTPAIADAKGLYIEDEGPSCWAEGSEDLRNAPAYVGIVAEYMERDRNHPSVVYWSTCNESHYGILFVLAHRYAKRLDPTRPVGGTYAPPEMDNNVYVIHHPTNTHDHIEETSAIDKPVFYDECLTVPHGWGDFAHSLELDPGMHDYWETNIHHIRRREMFHENQVGTMIWAWVDDAFCVPGRGICCWRRSMTPIRYSEAIYKLPGRGYQGDCVWGVVDAWRRPRPEWWLAKKIYSPLVIEDKPIAVPAPGEPIRIPVENLNWFTNLSAYECRWELLSLTGSARADVAPSSRGALEIPLPADLDGNPVVPDAILSLEWFDETGRLVDAYRLRFRERPALPFALGAPAQIATEEGRYLSGAQAVYLRGEDSELAFDRVSGVLMWGLKENEQILLTGPTLHILQSENPTGDDPVGWKFENETHEPGLVCWNGAFGEAFRGGYEVRMDMAGHIEIGYAFTYTGPEFYAREVGLEFELPLTFDTLSWERAAAHSCYPEDHIGRPRGVTRAHPPIRQSVPPGDRPFSQDDHAWGCNDFRSAKRGIHHAALVNPAGQAVRIVSDGSQTVRCTMGVRSISMKALDYYGGSGGPKEWSVLGFHYGPGRLIRSGETLAGKVKMTLHGAKRGA